MKAAKAPPKKQAPPKRATTSSEQITIEELAPVRAWARGNPGAIQKLADEIQAITGEDANRHMVGRWLRETEPVQPRFGYGMALLRAYETLANTESPEA